MDWFTVISCFIGLLAGFSVHESAHAWMGNKLGDSTAKDLGRISLNPLRHIDPIGSVVFPVIALVASTSLLGWAKPTPYNPENLKDPKKDELLIALAGPFSNILLALVSYALLWISVIIAGITAGLIAVFTGTEIDLNVFFHSMSTFFVSMMVVNFTLAFFNLLPVPPLDGSTFLKIFVPKRFNYQLALINSYGFYILMLASFTPLGNVVGKYIDTCVNFCMKIVGLN